MFMLTFLLYTVVFVLSTVGAYKFLSIAIQPGGFLGFWQHVLNWMYGKGWEYAEKFLGGCAICFAHFVSICSFFSYLLFMVSCVGWLPIQNTIAKVVVSIIWYVVYVTTSWFLCSLTIKKEQHGV